ncbi:hypothetical protein V8B97DRAFT_604040 [Scleroderma yunnanense]
MNEAYQQAITRPLFRVRLCGGSNLLVDPLLKFCKDVRNIPCHIPHGGGCRCVDLWDPFGFEEVTFLGNVGPAFLYFLFQWKKPTDQRRVFPDGLSQLRYKPNLIEYGWMNGFMCNVIRPCRKTTNVFFRQNEDPSGGAGADVGEAQTKPQNNKYSLVRILFPPRCYRIRQRCNVFKVHRQHIPDVGLQSTMSVYGFNSIAKNVPSSRSMLSQKDHGHANHLRSAVIVSKVSQGTNNRNKHQNVIL